MDLKLHFSKVNLKRRGLHCWQRELQQPGPPGPGPLRLSLLSRDPASLQECRGVAAAQDTRAQREALRLSS